MNMKHFVVYLLVLAGSVVVVLAERSSTHVSEPPRESARIVPQGPARNSRARSVPARQVASAIHSLNPVTVRPGRAKILPPRLAHVSIPITFEPNVGQADSRIDFLGRGKGLMVFLTRDEIALRVGRSENGAAYALKERASAAQPVPDGALTLRIAGNSGFEWEGSEKLRAESNYFVGNDPKKWHTQVPHFARAEASSASAGVGVAVYGNDEGVEYDLRVAPGVDVSKLRLTVAGAQSMRLNDGGDLLIGVGGGEVKMKKPAVYEVSRKWRSSRARNHAPMGARRANRYTPRRTTRTRRGKLGSTSHKTRRVASPCAPKLPLGQQTATAQRDAPCRDRSGVHPRIPARTQRRRIGGEYVLEADGSIGFRIGPHDPGATLVVDPSLSIAYGTFLGGPGSDTAASIALDSSGKIYVGGTTTSTSFPGALTQKVGSADGPAQFFIAKIDPTLTGASSLVYLTFIGAGGVQSGGLIAVDASGNVAITGTTTATDFPVTDTTEPTSALGSGYGNDTIVSEIGPSGNSLVFSTLFGGSGTESQSGAGGIALDSSGDVYIASDVQTTPIDSASPDLPVTPNAYETAWDGEPADGFLAVFQPPATGSKAAILKYCSYLGTNSSGQPGVGGIAVDVSGNAYVAGFSSNSSNGFPTKNAIQAAYGGGDSDAFLMKISPAGNGATDLVYATLLGGSGTDEALAVALDSSNPPNAYVTGTTQSPNFPVNGAVGTYQSSLRPNATANAFLSVVSQNAISGQSALAYSTYFGGSRADVGRGVAVSGPNSVFLTGATNSADLPWRDNLQAFNGAGDAFVAKFNPTLPGAASFIYVTPLGGTSPAGSTASAVGNAVAADQSGHVYVVGASTSADFPTAVTTESAMNGFEASCSSCQLTPPLSDAFVAEIVESASPMPSVYFNVGRVPFLPGPVGTPSAPQPVAVFNGGEASLTISDIEIAGANAADFSLVGGSACLGQAISPGPTVKCSFEVGFTPSSVGPEVAVVAVFDNAPGSPQILELVAAGQAPAAAISPLNLNFGGQPQNSTSALQTITLTNAGTQTLTITSVVEGGPDIAVFANIQKSDPGTPSCRANIVLVSGGQCVAKYSFAPNAVRTFHAEVDFFDTSGQSPSAEQIVSLTGIGTATAPIANLSASSLAFGSETIGSSSGAQSVTLTNQGSAALSVTGVAFAGTNAADFAIAATGTTCPVAGGTLVVRASCTVAVELAPQTPGPKSASLAFTDNAAASPQQVKVTGTATSPQSLQVSPASLMFPAQSEGIGSAPQSVTILNSGAAAAEITGIAISGPNAADFTSPASCTPNPVPAGKSCQIGVTFMPGTTTPGIRSATLSVPAGSPPTVALSGTATQAGISVPTSINFGSQFAGGAGGPPQPIVVANSSSGAFAGALTIASVAKSGANPGDFALVADSCTGSSTPPGATCSVQVAFKPASVCPVIAGTRNAILMLNDNAPGSPHSVPLSGTAMEFCISTTTGQPVVGPVKAGNPATYSLAVSSFAGFTGSASLACAVQPDSGEASFVGSCAINTTPPTNPPVVQIAPGSPGQMEVVVTTVANPTAAIGPQLPRSSLRPGGRAVVWIGILLILLLLALPRGSRRSARVRMAQVVALVLASALIMASCGGGSSSNPVPVDPPGTQIGQYTVVITATSTLAGQPAETQYLIALSVN